MAQLYFVTITTFVHILPHYISYLEEEPNQVLLSIYLSIFINITSYQCQILFNENTVNGVSKEQFSPSNNTTIGSILINSATTKR